MNIHYFLKSKSAPFTLVKKISALCIAMLLLVLQAQAQVPLNDNPCTGATISAIPLTVSAACSFSTFTNVDASGTATAGIAAPTCANYTGSDVWFTVTVPAGATAVTVDTRNIGMTDGAMSIYTATGNCPSLILTQVGCDDNTSANAGMPRLTISQPAGTLLYVRIWGWGGETGTFGICATANIPPANNECVGAQLLTVNPNLLCGTVAAGTCANATQSTTTPLPACGTANT